MAYIAPRLLPTLSLLLADMPDGSLKEIAQYLGVTERTVYAWKAAEQAPRPVMLALFWESRWGKSALDAQLFNDAAVARQLARSLQRDNDRLQAQVQQLLATGEFSASNSPLFIHR